MASVVRPLRFLQGAAPLLGVLAVVSACSPADPIRQCAAPDQYASFSAPVSHFPVQVGVDFNFRDEDIGAIEQALIQWNDFSQQELHGVTVFEAAQTSIPESVRNLSAKSCNERFGLGEGGNGFFLIRVNSPKRWSQLGFSDQVPAVTVRCENKRDLSQQVVLVNTRLAFPGSMTTILLHEFGHALGLGHSCIWGQGRSDYKGCDSLLPDDPYRQAVMYPALDFPGTLAWGGESKETLQKNDRERAKCLYGSM